MDSAVADLRRGVVGFIRRCVDKRNLGGGGGRGDGGIMWVGQGCCFCEPQSPPCSSGDCGWPEGIRSGEELAGIEQREEGPEERGGARGSGRGSPSEK